MNNVVKHASANHCCVRLGLANGLEIEISDDGKGLPVPPPPGMGLSSMHDRAQELGGICLVEASPVGGTRVRARLPLANNSLNIEERKS